MGKAAVLQPQDKRASRSGQHREAVLDQAQGPEPEEQTAAAAAVVPEEQHLAPAAAAALQVHPGAQEDMGDLEAEGGARVIRALLPC
jgi:hypothetical protein